MRPADFEGGDRRAEVHAGRHDLCEKRVIELAADHRCHPNDLERLRIQVVESRADHALHRIRQRRARPRRSRHIASSSRTVTACCSSSAAHICSRKNGLPPARSYNRCASASDTRRTPRTACMMATDAGKSSRSRRTRVVCAGHSSWAAASARLVTISASGIEPTSSAMRRNAARDPVSAQCQSSTSTTTGARRARTPTMVASASSNAAWRCSPWRCRGRA